jgi:UDPglucose 6-dehydrogenase
MARIFVVGAGVVGTATGRGFVEAGHHVTFIDISPARIDFLSALGLDARSTIDLGSEGPSFIFLTLPTPQVGRRYDLTALTAGITAVGRAIAGSKAVHTVVVRSTVPPGTADGLVRPTLERTSGKTCDEGFTLASNPEFLRAASAAEDFRHPWVTVIAARNKRTQERLCDLFCSFGGEIRIFDDLGTAEVIKCAHNIYNATKISFWNEIWLVTQKLGIDHDAVAMTVARSAEASTNPLYGIRGGAPYGGSCLPKDTNGFLGFAEELGVHLRLLTAVVDVNEQLAAIASRELDMLFDASRRGAAAKPPAGYLAGVEPGGPPC